ncbi:unnamed protein product [Cochlearia groenlandica]
MPTKSSTMTTILSSILSMPGSNCEMIKSGVPLYPTKEMKAKKRKADNASTSSNSISQPQEKYATRSEAVKTTKAREKNNVQSEPSSQSLSTFQDMWTKTMVKEKDQDVNA